MEQFNAKVLTELLGQTVDITDSVGSGVTLTVSEVVESSMNGDEWEAFSVYLTGEESFHISQGTYKVAHSAFGERDLFISPKSPVEYEIIINRKRG
ncbi:DUF6916 family protein [Pseudoalteromonas phenolica]|jgi:hypothetical protein|uniref:DUF6916 family protein n=1 Tax=Pseudoalteromonas phenolica TaxID=161398 RepID=UPI00384FB379